MRRTGYRQGGSTINKKFVKKIKEVLSIVLDKKVLIGIGIGMIITVALMYPDQYSKNLSDSEIEEKARNLGMHYEDECKVFFKGDEISD